MFKKHGKIKREINQGGLDYWDLLKNSKLLLPLLERLKFLKSTHFLSALASNFHKQTETLDTRNVHSRGSKLKKKKRVL